MPGYPDCSAASSGSSRGTAVQDPYLRNIDARLVGAPADPGFTFRREPPARDWAYIGLALSAVLPNKLQPFVQFATIQGNENFVSYGGTAGLRKEV